MLESQHRRFLETLTEYVKYNPEVAAYISDSVREGLEQHIRDLKTHAVNVESLALTLATNIRKPTPEVLARVEKIRHNSFYSWDWLIGK